MEKAIEVPAENAKTDDSTFETSRYSDKTYVKIDHLWNYSEHLLSLDSILNLSLVWKHIFPIGFLFISHSINSPLLSLLNREGEFFSWRWLLGLTIFFTGIVPLASWVTNTPIDGSLDLFLYLLPYIIGETIVTYRISIRKRMRLLLYMSICKMCFQCTSTFTFLISHKYNALYIILFATCKYIPLHL